MIFPVSTHTHWLPKDVSNTRSRPSHLVIVGILWSRWLTVRLVLRHPRASRYRRSFNPTTPSRRSPRHKSDCTFTSIMFSHSCEPDLPDPSLPLRSLTHTLEWTTVRHPKSVSLSAASTADIREGFDRFPSVELLVWFIRLLWNRRAYVALHVSGHS